MNNSKERRLNGGEEEDDEDEGNGGDLEAWERAYADERSWESLQEDESGLLRPIDNTTLYHAQYRRRIRTATTARIQKGLIRYLFIVIDLSKACTTSLLCTMLNYNISALFYIIVDCSL